MRISHFLSLLLIGFGANLFSMQKISQPSPGQKKSPQKMRMINQSKDSIAISAKDFGKMQLLLDKMSQNVVKMEKGFDEKFEKMEQRFSELSDRVKRVQEAINLSDPKCLIPTKSYVNSLWSGIGQLYSNFESYVTLSTFYAELAKCEKKDVYSQKGANGSSGHLLVRTNNLSGNDIINRKADKEHVECLYNDLCHKIYALNKSNITQLKRIELLQKITMTLLNKDPELKQKIFPVHMPKK